MKTYFYSIVLLIFCLGQMNFGFSQTKTELLKKCELAYDLNDYKSLLTYCNQYLALDTMNARVYTLKGIALEYDNECGRFFNKGLMLNPFDIEAKTYIKRNKRLEGPWMETSYLAYTEYLNAIVTDSNDFFSFLALSEKLIFNEPYIGGMPMGRDRENIDTIDFFLEKAVYLRPKNINALLLRANFLSETERFYAALFDYEKILKLQPSNLEALQGRAKAYQETKQYSKAIVDFTKLIEIDGKDMEEFPSKKKYFLHRGNCYAKIGNRTQAIIDLNKGINPYGFEVIEYKRHQWKWNDDGCIDQWGFILHNKSEVSINRIVFKLIITDPNSETEEVVYRASGIPLDIKLKPGDVLPTSFFKISELCFPDYIFQDFDYYFELEKIE